MPAGAETATLQRVRQAPRSGHAFAFFNRRRDRVKLLVFSKVSGEMKRAEGAEMLAVEGQAKCRTAPRLGTTSGPRADGPGLHPGLGSAAPPGLRTSAWPHFHHEPRRGGTHEPGVQPLAQPSRQLSFSSRPLSSPAISPHALEKTLNC